MRAGLVVAGLLHLVGAGSLPAQQRAAPFIRWEPAASPETSPSSHTPKATSAGLGDYRYEGLAFGGVVLGALGVWAGSRISTSCLLEPGVPCPSNKTENAVALGVVGAVIGGGLGYLVGRFSPKRPPQVEQDLPLADLVGVPDSVRSRTGYQHWRGGAIGLAVGGALGALTGAAVGYGCADCRQETTMGGRALTVGILGAGAGGVLGFLAGLASPKYAWIPRAAQ